MPSNFSPEASDLVSKLLDKNPSTRIGCVKERGILDIKEHPWFAEIDWDKLAKKQLTPPYQPKLDG
jgi:serine/threonine protein kinase